MGCGSSTSAKITPGREAQQGNGSAGGAAVSNGNAAAARVPSPSGGVSQPKDVPQPTVKAPAAQAAAQPDPAAPSAPSTSKPVDPPKPSSERVQTAPAAPAAETAPPIASTPALAKEPVAAAAASPEQAAPSREQHADKAPARMSLNLSSNSCEDSSALDSQAPPHAMAPGSARRSSSSRSSLRGPLSPGGSRHGPLSPSGSRASLLGDTSLSLDAIEAAQQNALKHRRSSNSHSFSAQLVELAEQDQKLAQLVNTRAAIHPSRQSSESLVYLASALPDLDDIDESDSHRPQDTQQQQEPPETIVAPIQGGYGIATNEPQVIHMQCEYVEPTPEQLAAAAAENAAEEAGKPESVEPALVSADDGPLLVDPSFGVNGGPDSVPPAPKDE